MSNNEHARATHLLNDDDFRWLDSPSAAELARLIREEIEPLTLRSARGCLQRLEKLMMERRLAKRYRPRKANTDSRPQDGSDLEKVDAELLEAELGDGLILQFTLAEAKAAALYKAQENIERLRERLAEEIKQKTCSRRISVLKYIDYEVVDIFNQVASTYLKLEKLLSTSDSELVALRKALHKQAQENYSTLQNNAKSLKKQVEKVRNSKS